MQLKTLGSKSPGIFSGKQTLKFKIMQRIRYFISTNLRYFFHAIFPIPNENIRVQYEMVEDVKNLFDCISRELECEITDIKYR